MRTRRQAALISSALGLYELGAPIQPTSQERGKQYEVQIQIYQVMKI